MYNLKVNKEEAKFLIQVLAELPTKTNAYILYRNLNEQMTAQDSELTEQDPEDAVLKNIADEIPKDKKK